ncbi:MAG: hypothetical protein HUK26_06825, partial [Duodenibacillus sp.]|nr:hypothetical protein [Duodenibacillus sp.]
ETLNTFRTIKVGGELVDVIKAGEADLSMAFAFEPPAIAGFYDAKMRSEFDALTQKLRTGK